LALVLPVATTRIIPSRLNCCRIKATRTATVFDSAKASLRRTAFTQLLCGIYSNSGVSHHAPVRVLPHIKRLDDCFGDLLLRVVCECGTCREIPPQSLAWLAGK